MTVDSTVDPIMSPAYLLRAYTWALLKRNDSTTWDESKYGGLEPIVPLNEEPELSEYDGPYIVYGYTTDFAGSNPAAARGSLAYAIYDQNFRRLTKTMNILTTAFEREDEAARDVNAFTSSIPQFRGLRFSFIRLGFVEGGTPEETEGGRQSAIITIQYEYYVNYNIQTSLV